VPASEPVRLVLESDGTQVEDGEYFRTLANNTILLLLRQGERWYPTGVDVIKAGMLLLLESSHRVFSDRRLFSSFSNICHTKNRLRDDSCLGTS
jgi:CIDE-N domain